MKLLQVVPDAPYFVWQLYLQMLNFRDHGIEKDAVILVAINGSPSPVMKTFEGWTAAKVHYYNDTRVSAAYTSSIRPNILKQYWNETGGHEVFLYHDQDIIFQRKPDFKRLEEGETCYTAAAAHNYTGWEYLNKFKKYIIHSMMEIVGISDITVSGNDASAGGAQCVIKHVTTEWWEKVESDCEKLYKYMNHAVSHGLREFHPEEVLPSYHIQVWTADMWALLWNMWLSGKKTEHAPEIDFSWPWEMIAGSKNIIHNAGITGTSEKDEKGNVIYFNKSRFNGSLMPFDKNFDFVPADRCQHIYVNLFKRFTISNNTIMTKNKQKILGVFCTTNKLHPDLLKTVLKCIQAARDNTTEAEVEIITCSWEPIPDNPFKGLLTPFRNMGHLNYLLQMKQVSLAASADIVCMLEHDVLYPPQYFNEVIRNWDFGKYGVTYDNYIGMNETGYLDVKERHQPMSLMSMAKFYFDRNIDAKINQCIRTIGNSGVTGWDTPFGWCCVEPDNKNDFARIPFTNNFPAIHVNMNHVEGNNHHFTTHCEVCYEQDSNGKEIRTDWGNYINYFSFTK